MRRDIRWRAGAAGLPRRSLAWVQHQRCVWHLWRNLGGELAKAASQAAGELTGAAAEAIRQQTRAELGELIHQIVDARSYAQAEAALAARDTRVVLARLPSPTQPRPQPSLGSAPGAGGPGLGHLP